MNDFASLKEDGLHIQIPVRGVQDNIVQDYIVPNSVLSAIVNRFFDERIERINNPLVDLRTAVKEGNPWV